MSDNKEEKIATAIEYDSGFELEIEEGTGRIVSITNYGRKISLGDKVVSNGNHTVYDGVPGTVEKIYRPNEEGRPCEVLEIQFFLHEIAYRMKFEDLRMDEKVLESARAVSP
ncbi:MAG TPA: hypothetical protein VHQ41_01445 [Patescibacteria group bacterium]|jgi:hypothetical protein|nr:hypothetical protein [Patescibacteria group bacterium]